MLNGKALGICQAAWDNMNPPDDPSWYWDEIEEEDDDATED